MLGFPPRTRFREGRRGSLGAAGERDAEQPGTGHTGSIASTTSDG